MQWNHEHDIDPFAKKSIRCHARRLVGKAGLTRDDIEDLEQELTCDLLQRMTEFNSTKASHHTFIERVVSGKACKILRYHLAEMRSRRREHGSLDLEIAMEDTGHISPRTNLIDSDAYDVALGRRGRGRLEEYELKTDVDAVLRNLPPHLRDICERLKDETQVEVEKSLGYSHGSFRNKVIAPLRAAFEKAGLRAFI